MLTTTRSDINISMIWAGTALIVATLLLAGLFVAGLLSGEPFALVNPGWDAPASPQVLLAGFGWEIPPPVSAG
ncbi:hypothetical protein [Polymorphospora rubra]